MVDKTKPVDPGKLTAYERWELPNIGSNAPDRKLSNAASQKPRPPTADDIEKIRKQAYDAGFEEGRKAGFDKGHNEGLVSGKDDGFKQGLAEGLEEGQSQISDHVARLERLLSELLAPIEKQQNLIEEAMLNVSMAVARTVIHKELSLDASSIQMAIKSILDDLPKVDKGFSLIIHPDDEPHVRPVIEKYDAAITLKLDPSITPGGCFFNSSTQLIDYTIEKRFQKTVQAMLSEAVKNTSADSNLEVPSSIGALSDYPAQTLSEESVAEQGSPEQGSAEQDSPEQGSSEQNSPEQESSEHSASIDPEKKAIDEREDGSQDEEAQSE